MAPRRKRQVKNVVVYARRSKAQNDKRGVDIQLDHCRAYAAEHGWAIVAEMVDEGRSAYAGTKPSEGYEAMLDTIRAGQAVAVLCYKDVMGGAKYPLDECGIPAMMASARWKEFCSSLLLGFSIVALAVLVTPQRARAVSCTVDGTGVGGWESSTPTSRYGVWVNTADRGMDVNVASPDCTRVGSVYVFGTNINAVEIGWYLDPGPATDCSNGNQANPHILVDRYVNGTEFCKTGTSTLTQGYHGFKVANPNHDLYWDFHVDGNSEGSYPVNFTSGYVLFAAERHSGTDAAYDDFDGLYYLGSGGSWNAWANTASSGSGTGGNNPYLYCYYSHTHTAGKITC